MSTEVHIYIHKIIIRAIEVDHNFFAFDSFYIQSDNLLVIAINEVTLSEVIKSWSKIYTIFFPLCLKQSFSNLVWIQVI